MDHQTDISALDRLSLTGLRAEWSRHFGEAPELRSSDFLRLILAWRLQAKQYGGLSLTTRRQLKRTGPIFVEGLDLGVGAKVVRAWQGKTEVVTVEKNAFRWNGNSYPSLSAVALAMTGSRKNGPKFFGLRTHSP